VFKAASMPWPHGRGTTTRSQHYQANSSTSLLALPQTMNPERSWRVASGTVVMSGRWSSPSRLDHTADTQRMASRHAIERTPRSGSQTRQATRAVPAEPIGAGVMTR
jgi:hypothetical protein